MLAVRPDTFLIEKSLNTFTSVSSPVNVPKAVAQHAALCREVNAHVAIPPRTKLPDVVFTANAGLYLPRLPQHTVLLSNMKHLSRAKETPFVQKYLHDLGIKTILFPKKEVFEGQGEAKWFYEGKLLVVGYGFRSTAATIPLLQRVLDKVYHKHNVIPPKVVGMEMALAKFYHLDIAMACTDSTSCVAHTYAFKHPSKLEKWVNVRWMDTKDPFALNMIVLKDRVVTHKLRYAKEKRLLEKVIGKPIVEIDVSEFEKSGGSVRCMILDFGRHDDHLLL